MLDLNQEEVAKRWIGEGHRILFGVAGSGKTVILLARARYQARLQPDHDILVLCYNTVLMHYLAKCLADYDNITVRTFHSWAGEAVGDSSWWTGPGSEEEKGQTLLKKLRAQGVRKRYHCILIDECQDWCMSWFRAVLLAARDPIEGDLLIVGDGSQQVYSRTEHFTWKSCGIQARGRVLNRKGSRVDTFRNYRNTPEIVALASAFAKQTRAASRARKRQEQSDEVMFSFLASPEECAKPASGWKPLISRARDMSDELDLAFGSICNLRREFPQWHDSDFAVLCRSHEHGLGTLERRLKREGYRVEWIRYGQNQGAVRRDCVILSNVRQAKGLEFKVCFVVGACEYEADEAELLYVALTRATERLYVSHHDDSSFVRILMDDQALYKDGNTDRNRWRHSVRHVAEPRGRYYD